MSQRSSMMVALAALAFLVASLQDGQAAELPAGNSSLRVYDDSQERAQAQGMLAAYVARSLAPIVEQREKELSSLASPEQWRRRQDRVRQELSKHLGEFGPKCPLEARTVGKLDRPNYVIEKVVFQSQRGYFCTTNLYLPKRRPLPRPGVLLTCGHSADGKACRLYHEACLGLVLKGYIVLALDPTGQGERSEYFDPATGKPTVPLTVSQHHYLGRPSWLVGRTLAGYRTWDAIRAVDYLVSRPEVDREKIGATGNSGGGIMAMLITACDPRIKVCAAAHPGGSMEQTYLTGRSLAEAEILSLIPPRPCAIVVGRDSHEAAGHQAKLDGMSHFYRGLGVDPGRGQMFIVDGVHDMKQPKRLVCYAWLNRWLGQEREGADEPALSPEAVADLNCTPTGLTVRDLKSETGQTLNAKLAEKLRPPRAVPESKAELEKVRAELRAAVTRRIGLNVPEVRRPPQAISRGTIEQPAFAAEKLVLQTDAGIQLPALFLRPAKPRPSAPLVLHAAELGKPMDPTGPCIALELVRAGYRVLSIDVRGAGETDPRDRAKLPPLDRYYAPQFQFDCSAIQCAAFGTTLLAQQGFDLIRAMDYIGSRQDVAADPVVLVGEGLGGVWCLLAAAMDRRPSGVIAAGTVPSYKLIVDSQYYAARDYFWVPGALVDFDLPDLIGLIAPRSAALVDPADAMLTALSNERCRTVCARPAAVYKTLGVPDRFAIVSPPDIVKAQATAARVIAGLRMIESASGSGAVR